MASPLALGAARQAVPRHVVRQRTASRSVPVVAHSSARRASSQQISLARTRRESRIVLAAAESNGPAPAPSSTSEADEENAYLFAEATRIIKLLYDKRGMKLNEVKLIMGIEDPRAAARREQYGIEDESGASRDDITEALEEVAAGRVPRDIVAFRQLVAELQAWPYLEQEDAIRSDGPSPYAEITETGLSRSERKAQAMARAKVNEEEELIPEKDLSDFLPKWFGYSAVYVVSAIPVFITLSALALLFVTSLK